MGAKLVALDETAGRLVNARDILKANVALSWTKCVNFTVMKLQHDLVRHHCILASRKCALILRNTSCCAKATPLLTRR